MSSMPSVYVLDPYHLEAIRLLQKQKDINLILSEDSEEKLKWHKNATALLIRSDSQITEADLSKAGTNLKYIVKQGVGVDNVDLQAATRNGVQVFNTPGINSESVAEFALTLALCIARRVNEVDRNVRNGDKIVRSKILGKSLYHKTLGIVGMGNIGVQVAKKWIGAMDGSVIAFDPYAPPTAWIENFNSASWHRVNKLEELLAASDVVTLHVPLTKSTEKMLSEKEFAMMKDGAILLNCARGGVVDEDALLAALESGRLFGAGLDATLFEPPTLEQYSGLLDHPRVLVTPHIGASTVDNQANSGVAAAQIVLHLLRGDVADEPMPTPLN